MDSLNCGRTILFEIIIDTSFNPDDFIIIGDGSSIFPRIYSMKGWREIRANLNIIYTRNGQFYSGVPILIAIPHPGESRGKQTRVHRKVFWEYVNPTGDYL